MPLNRALAGVVTTVTLLAATSCGDLPSSPGGENSPGPQRSAGSSDLLAPTTAIPLHRTAPLPVAQTASARIGVLGGTLSLPGAGLTVVVPPLAVLMPVTMTVTAPAGGDVVYEFAPHGIAFLTPLIATQDLSNTEAHNGGLINPASLYVGYFPDSDHYTTVTELLSLRVDLLGQTSTALLWHFSGYMWSSGREDDSAVSAASRRASEAATLTIRR